MSKLRETDAANLARRSQDYNAKATSRTHDAMPRLRPSNQSAGVHVPILRENLRRAVCARLAGVLLGDGMFRDIWSSRRLDRFNRSDIHGVEMMA